MAKRYSYRIIVVLLIVSIFLSCKKNTDSVITAEQFIKYSINTVPYDFSTPVDTFYHSESYGLTAMAIFGNNIISPLNNVSLLMAYPGIAVGSYQNLMAFNPHQITGNLLITTPILVNITEFGAVGQFIAGEFTGVFTGPPPANMQYNITCSFRVRR